MKNLTTKSYLILKSGYLILKDLFDPATEGNPYEKELPKEKPFFIFGQNLRMRLTRFGK